MRLSDDYRRQFVTAAREAFGPTAVVRLFGSRLDDTAKGGDFDLHVEADRSAGADQIFPPAIRMRAALFDRLDGEPIDVVVRYRDQPPRWIDTVAVEQGIVL